MIEFPFYTETNNGRFPSVSRIEKNKVYSRDFIEQEMIPCLLNVEDNPIVNDPPICYVWKYLFKRSIIEKNNVLFDERRRKWEDKGFVVQYVDCIDSIVFFDKPLYSYVCLDTGDHLSSSYFRDLVFLIIEQREEYIKKYGERYSFDTDYYTRNSISTIIARIEEIVEYENEEDAKRLISEIYSKPFVQSLAEWIFTDDEKMSQYQLLIRNNDIDETYVLMQQQIEQKKKLQNQQRSMTLVERIKRKTKERIRPLYNRLKK